MSDRPLWQWSACDLAAAIAEGRISSREAVAAAVGRMHAVNPAINAVVRDLSDAAFEEAERLDSLRADGTVIGPLHGVPITIKDNIDQEGLPNPNGVVALQDVTAPANSPFVNNMKKAGAVVIGRTNTPEFSFRLTTANDLYGRTYNPWNSWASSGGSSGGASSAVMSGMGALAHGNDIAGSLRYPATMTGAVTVKPGFGRVPSYNPSRRIEAGILAQVMAVQGVIARESRDVRLGTRVSVVYDAHDPWMVSMPFDGPPIDGPIKVGFTRNAYEFDLHPAVETALVSACDALADAGYQVEEVDPPDISKIGRQGMRTLLGELKVLMLPDIHRFGSETINTIFRHYFEQFPPYEGDELLRALGRRSHYVRQWLLFLQDYPLVLTPFLLAPTFAWDRDTMGWEGVHEVIGTGIYSFSMNFLGLPAGNVPANYNSGLPVGVQIVGRRFREDMILDACEAVEARVGVMAERLFSKG